MGQPVEKLRRDGSQLPRAVAFTGPWSRGSSPVKGPGLAIEDDPASTLGDKAFALQP